MDVASILLTIVFWIVCGFGISCSRMICSYHETKPPGQQTFLGKVIALGMDFYALLMLYGLAFFTYVNVGILTEFWSGVLTFLGLYCFLATQLSIIIALVTRYLSVYHSHLIFALNESRAVRNLRLLIIVLSLILTILEYSYLTTVKDTDFFHILMMESGGPGKTEKTKGFLTVCIIVAVMVLQSRLEYDNFKHGDNPSCCLHLIFKTFCGPQDNTVNVNVPNVNQDPEEYKMGVLRISACVVTLFCSIILYKIFDGQVDVYRVVAVVYILVNVLLAQHLCLSTTMNPSRNISCQRWYPNWVPLKCQFSMCHY